MGGVLGWVIAVELVWRSVQKSGVFGAGFIFVHIWVVAWSELGV